MAKMRKSIIRKAVIRKLNTAKYETIDIIVEHEHEIEWIEGDIKSLMSKSENVGKLVLKDYQETEAQVLRELNLCGHKAFVNDPGTKRPTNKNDFEEL